MKSIVINFGLFIMIIISGMIIMSVSRKQIIKEEATEALSVSVRNSMELWVDNKNLNEIELIKNFMEVFKTNISSNCDYKIYFYEVDTYNGLMDVEVEAVFNYPNFKQGTINIRKTLIYDEKIT